MGFYGNIKNTSRTQFSFDKIYPSRAEMDANANLDGIYAGRFVLVEYDQVLHRDSFPVAILKGGVLYSAIPSSSEGLLEPYVLTTDEATGNTAVKAGQIFNVPGALNFDKVTEEDTLYVIRGAMITKENVPQYTYVDGKLYEARDLEGRVIYQETLNHVDFTLFTAQTSDYTGSDAAGTSSYLNYLNNYNIDKVAYGISRGYDSTVWQKVYNGSTAKYVMVAELNSVIPTFDLSADAPTTTPTLPHFDVDSTNVYYKLHWQPSWGFRVKGSNPTLNVPELKTDGSVANSSNVRASTGRKEYPSDATTSWFNQVIDPNNGESVELTYVPADPNGSPAWVLPEDVRENANQFPAAIYFNKQGFRPDTINYSYDKEYAGWPDSRVVDEILVSPTGRSGHTYNAHDKGLAYKSAEPDTQELSIMLPSIGDALASVWDLIYGGRKVYGPNAKSRNMDVEWYNAKAVSEKKGLRMIEMKGPGNYTYNRDAASTVAGILNSVQDLMGMIITPNIPTDNIAGLNDDYIYFKANEDGTGTYNFKHKYYKYTTKTFPNNRIPDNYNEYESTSLMPWDKAYFYLDTASSYGAEFIMEDKFYPDRKYIQKALVQNALRPVNLTAEYVADGTFFKRLSDNYPSAGGKSGASYNYYVGTTEAYQTGTTYYQLTLSDKQLGENDAIYVPNTYYYVDYKEVSLTNVTYEPGVYYYIKLYTNVGGADGNEVKVPQYALATGETMDDNFNADEQVVHQYFKRTYSLDTSLTKGDHVYYRVRPNSGQNSNAYYQSIEWVTEAPITYESYMADKYYYRINPADFEDGVLDSLTTKVIDSQTYLRDPNVYSLEEWNQLIANGRKYFNVNQKFELVQGEDVLEITDENAILVENMQDMNEFKSVNPTGGTNVFYAYIDSENVTRYIEVTYNNFSKSYNPSTQRYELLIMDYQAVGDPYVPKHYYYEVTDESTGKAGSFLIDGKSSITPGRQYYELPKENQTIFEEFKFLDGYYTSNKYYIEYPAGSGKYIISEDPNFDPAANYLDPTLRLYVKEDTEGIYKPGAEWPMEVKQIPDSVTLATREDAYELKVLEGFGDKMTTLHSMLLQMYKHLDPTDNDTRDITTGRGTVNLINDLMHRFAALSPGQITVVDSYGRMHSAKHSTKQTISYSNPNVSATTAPSVTKENALITLTINDNYKQPTISLTHSNVTPVADTNNEVNLDSAAVDNFEIVQPITDNAGHVAGLNKTNVILPKSFKTIAIGTQSTTENALTANTTSVVADNARDTFTIATGNKWINVAGTDGTSNTITLAHSIVTSTWAGQKSNSQDATPAFGSNFRVPVITTDNAGHITAFTTETVKIPGLTFIPDKTDTKKDVVLSINYSYDSTKDIGTISETRGNVDNLTIQDYDIANGSDSKLANSDSIHGAFEKLQAQINAMDLTTVGGGTGEYITSITEADGKVTATKSTLPTVNDTAVDGEFVNKVSESNGKISVTRTAFVPSVTINAGTDSDAPSINITINGKSATAQSITKATTNVFGVTKLTSDFSSTSTDLAVNGTAVNAALNTLTVTGVANIDASKTIKSWSETNGKVAIETQDIVISNANVATNAAIAISKIDGLQNALDSKQPIIPNETYDAFGSAQAVIGKEDDAEDALTIYGLLAKIALLEARLEALENPSSNKPEGPVDNETTGDGTN